MNLRQVWMFALFASLGVGVTAVRSGEKDDALSRFQREARQGWAKLEKMEEGLEFKIRVTTLNPEATKPENRKTQYVATWKRSPGCIRFERTTISDNRVTARKAIVVNPQYEFLVRSSTTDKDAWELGGFRLRNPDDPDPRVLLIYQSYLLPQTCLEHVSGLRLSNMLSDLDCQVESAEMKEQFVRVRLNVESIYGQKVLPRSRMDVLFDPTRHWAICESGSVSDEQPQFKRKTEWSDKMIGGYRPPSKITTEYRRPKQPDKPYLTRIAEFESVKPYSASPDEFRLTAFGFPEPPGVEQPKSSWKWPILIGGASMCGLVSLLFAWMGKRKKKTMLTENPT